MIDEVRLNINKPVIMMSNLSFDHPLSYMELVELQNLLISNIRFRLETMQNLCYTKLNSNKKGD